MNISLDQASSATGICFWRDGKPVSPLVTVWKPRKVESFEDGCSRMVSGIIVNINDRTNEYDEPVDCIVMEDFVKFQAKARVQALRKLFTFSGYLRRALEEFYPSARIIGICKGNAPKTDAKWLAKAHSLTGSEHALDALHLGLLAGFDRKGPQ